MNRPHLAAALCFAVALAFYAAGLASDYTAGFFVLGMVFEVIAWKHAISAWRERRAASS